MTKLKHGLRATYNIYKCRCEKCTAANSSYSRDYMRKAYRRVREEKLRPRTHGTLRSYDFYGCRCSACKEVALRYRRDYMRKYRQRVQA